LSFTPFSFEAYCSIQYCNGYCLGAMVVPL
jgi:hypothetical protein